MDNVKLEKKALIEKIKANMETHQTTYERAVEEFNKQQIKLLEEMVGKARDGQKFDRMALSRMPVPENHMDDYRRALALLEMETREKIVLAPHDFNKFVLDEWEWQRAFVANTSSYLVTP